MGSKETGFLFEEICMWHDPGNRSVFDDIGLYFQPSAPQENAETKRRLKNLLEVTGIIKELQIIPSSPASLDQLTLFHTPSYIETLQRNSENGPGDAGDCSTYAKGGFEIAKVSAGLAVQAVKSVLAGEVKNAYALCRPPGHHAHSDSGSGFCLLGNIPIAALSAMKEGTLKRVAVVDWDVHHGNGTQEAFYHRNDALTISIHHDNNFPANSGHIHERGEGDGFGYNLNIPLPAGSGIGAYLETLKQLVIPALKQFNPDLIIVACGYDASAYDPIGPMILNSECYRTMTQLLMDTADEVCEGKLVFTHEGGYSETYVPYCGLAVIEALSGKRTPVHDVISDEIACWGQQDIQPHQQALIDQIKPYLTDIKPFI